MTSRSRVHVFPPAAGFQPMPESAKRHLPEALERSKCILSKVSLAQRSERETLAETDSHGHVWIKSEGQRDD